MNIWGIIAVAIVIFVILAVIAYYRRDWWGRIGGFLAAGVAIFLGWVGLGAPGSQ